MPTTLQRSKDFYNFSGFCTLSNFAAVIGISKATAYRMEEQGRDSVHPLGEANHPLQEPPEAVDRYGDWI